jgi:hypothetical protein
MTPGASSASAVQNMGRTNIGQVVGIAVGGAEPPGAEGPGDGQDGYESQMHSGGMGGGCALQVELVRYRWQMPQARVL